MIDLKNVCLLLIFAFIFVTHSAAQQKPTPKTTPAVIQPVDKVNPATKRFESKAGNFSVNISQEPTQTRALDAEKGQAAGKQFFWQSEKTVYTIMYSDFNENDLSKVFEQMNNGTRNSLEKMDGKLISERAISYGKHSGREFRYQASNGVKYVMRNFLINKTGYLVTAGYAADVDEKTVLAILDSFKLIIEKK